MQSIFRLPWCSEHLAPKLVDKPAYEPVVEIPGLSRFKRKRAASSEQSDSPSPSPSLPPSKKSRPDGADSLLPPTASGFAPAKAAVQQTPALASEKAQSSSTRAAETASLPPLHIPARDTAPPSSVHTGGNTILSTSDAPPTLTADSQSVDVEPSAVTSESTANMSALQEVIGNQFNMQILLKHDELRLIEQELAKCQVALEQLRRCELRPFPGSNQFSDSVSSGTGYAIQPPPGMTIPPHPSPYGVMDGPYTRHYQHWLIHDPMFDPMSEQAFAMLESNAAGRPTRNGGIARKSASKSVSLSTRPSESLQSIPNYPAPAPPRDKSSPLVLKRSTDGQLVKLICNNCQRGNFSSIQGFLNHCRIAHKVDLKSHDEAAVKCGQALDENEVANLSQLPVSTPVSKPTANRSSVNLATPGRSVVHPFNAAGNASLPASPSTLPSVARKAVPSLNSTTSSSASSPFTPSGHVPRLSAHFAKHRLGGDLAKATTLAKQKVDLGDELLSPDVAEEMSPLVSAPGSRMMPSTSHVGVERPSDGEARPPSRKGFRQPASQRPRPSPLVSMPGQQVAREALESPQDSLSAFLSPHTVDSNPGLVSDHDDDDQGSASEDETPRTTNLRSPLPPVGRTCADNMELDVEEGHDIDRSGVMIRRNSLHGEDERALQGAVARSMRKFGGGKS